MADLSALIRLHKYELDEKRRVLAELYLSMAALERERREMERLFELEKAAVADTENLHFTFASYVEKMKKRRAELDQLEAGLEKKIEQAKESMMDTFSELKKYQMTQDERDRLEDEERRFKEAKVMDDIGLESFRRKTEE